MSQYYIKHGSISFPVWSRWGKERSVHNLRLHVTYWQTGQSEVSVVCFTIIQVSQHFQDKHV